MSSIPLPLCKLQNRIIIAVAPDTRQLLDAKLPCIIHRHVMSEIALKAISQDCTNCMKTSTSGNVDPKPNGKIHDGGAILSENFNANLIMPGYIPSNSRRQLGIDFRRDSK